MAMPMEEGFRALADRWTDEIVVTSAGNSSEVWWEITGETERCFYLEASMSLSTMFASGIAMGYPDTKVWAFIGDGAFVMNTGVLFTESALALPNMVTVVCANRCYGSTKASPLPGGEAIRFDEVARACGIPRVFRFETVADMTARFGEAFRGEGPALVVMELEPPTREHASPPFDGPELKYRFGRFLERRFERAIFP